MPTKAKSMFLIRDVHGRMRTLTGFSARGAVREFLWKYPVKAGETIEVKERGKNGWTAFKVS